MLTRQAIQARVKTTATTRHDTADRQGESWAGSLTTDNRNCEKVYYTCISLAKNILLNSINLNSNLKWLLYSRIRN